MSANDHKTLADLRHLLNFIFADPLKVRIKGNLDVAGNSTASGNAIVAGNADIEGSADVKGGVNIATGSTYQINSVPLTHWTYLSAPLTSTSWDGDAFSTTAKTLIDLSAVFGVPAGVKAVAVMVSTRDSGSAANDCYITLSPNNAGYNGPKAGPAGRANDAWDRAMLAVPCDANGDIYYQIVASGASTLDVWLEIVGYEI